MYFCLLMQMYLCRTLQMLLCFVSRMLEHRRRGNSSSNKSSAALLFLRAVAAGRTTGNVFCGVHAGEVIFDSLKEYNIPIPCTLLLRLSALVVSPLDKHASYRCSDADAGGTSAAACVTLAAPAWPISFASRWNDSLSVAICLCISVIGFPNAVAYFICKCCICCHQTASSSSSTGQHDQPAPLSSTTKQYHQEAKTSSSRKQWQHAARARSRSKKQPQTRAPR